MLGYHQPHNVETNSVTDLESVDGILPVVDEELPFFSRDNLIRIEDFDDGDHERV